MIKADVTYNKAALIGLMRYNILSSPIKLLLYLFITAISLALMISNTQNPSFTVFLIVFILCMIVTSSVLLMYFLKPLIKLKSFTDDNTVMNYFIFTKDSILATSKSKIRTGSSTYKYEWILKACETKNAFYLFFNKEGGLIITKSEITEGTADQLRDLLSSKISEKRNKLNKSR